MSNAVSKAIELSYAKVPEINMSYCRKRYPANSRVIHSIMSSIKGPINLWETLWTSDNHFPSGLVLIITCRFVFT